MKIRWVTQSSLAGTLIVGATACANLIGLSEYEVDESSTGSPGGAGGRGGAGGTAGRGGAGGGTSGTGGSTAGTGGSSGCIPTGDPEECGANDECCDFESDRATCVDFPDRGTFCASRCASGSECISGCCAGLDSGNSACAFSEFCEGTGGTSGTGGSGGGIGSPCETQDAACGSGTSTGHCNGRWCTKPCTSSAECPGDTWCIPNNAGSDTCFVGCLTTADCAPLVGTTCQAASDVSDLPISVCALPPST